MIPTMQGRSDCFSMLMEFVIRNVGEGSLKRLLAVPGGSGTAKSSFAFWQSYVTEHRELAEMNEAMGSGDAYNKERNYDRGEKEGRRILSFYRE
jgi:hypothetical protein